jgi:hypothetical protein
MFHVTSLSDLRWWWYVSSYIFIFVIYFLGYTFVQVVLVLVILLNHLWRSLLLYFQNLAEFIQWAFDVGNCIIHMGTIEEESSLYWIYVPPDMVFMTMSHRMDAILDAISGMLHWKQHRICFSLWKNNYSFIFYWKQCDNQRRIFWNICTIPHITFMCLLMTRNYGISTTVSSKCDVFEILKEHHTSLSTMEKVRKLRWLTMPRERNMRDIVSQRSRKILFLPLV